MSFLNRIFIIFFKWKCSLWLYNKNVILNKTIVLFENRWTTTYLQSFKVRLLRQASLPQSICAPPAWSLDLPFLQTHIWYYNGAHWANLFIPSLNLFHTLNFKDTIINHLIDHRRRERWGHLKVILSPLHHTTPSYTVSFVLLWAKKRYWSKSVSW